MSLAAKTLVRDGESVERALRRFKRKVEQEGIPGDMRKGQYYLKPSQKRKLKKRAAKARARKRQQRSQTGPVFRV